MPVANSLTRTGPVTTYDQSTAETMMPKLWNRIRNCYFMWNQRYGVNLKAKAFSACRVCLQSTFIYIAIVNWLSRHVTGLGYSSCMIAYTNLTQCYIGWLHHDTCLERVSACFLYTASDWTNPIALASGDGIGSYFSPNMAHRDVGSPVYTRNTTQAKRRLALKRNTASNYGADESMFV